MYTNPQPNQNPGFQQPYGYQAPPPQKKGPGCWLWVPLGCLVFLIIGGIIATISVKQALQGSSGVFGGAMKSATDIADATTKLTQINAAVNQYYKTNNTYPSSLTQLVPTYLPSAASLHSSADPNPNPTNVSFKYTRPSNNAPPSTIYLAISDSFTMAIGQQSVTTTTVMHMSLDGQLTRQQTQTQSTGATTGQTGGAQ